MDLAVSRRFINGLGANFFGQTINVAVQLIGVPILLHAWGVRLYGEWLILFALPAYLSITDLGFCATAASDMTHLVSRGNRTEALAVFQSTSVLVFGAAGSGIVLAAMVLFWFLSPSESFQFSEMTADEARWILWFFCAEVLFRLTEGVSYAGFRAGNEYALYSFVNNMSRLVQFITMWVIALVGGGPLLAALGFFSVRILVTPFVALLLVRRHVWLSFGVEYAQISHLRRLSVPALANFSMPVAQALNIQGMVLVIGATLGPLAVVTFSTLRTITRLALQLVFAVSHAAEPEIALAYGVGNVALLQSLFVHSLRAGLWLAVSAAVVLSLIGDTLISQWTRGIVSIDWQLFRYLLASAISAALWYGGLIVLKASNKHVPAALAFVFSSGAAVLATAAVLHVSGRLADAGLVLLTVDGVMTILVLRAVSQIIGVRSSTLLIRAIDPIPVVRMLTRRLNVG